jgi:hypothetical protein
MGEQFRALFTSALHGCEWSASRSYPFTTGIHLDLGRFFRFLVLYTVGRTPWTEDQPVARPLPTRRTTQTQNKRIQTFMPSVGFEPTIPAFERAKRVQALDCAASVISRVLHRFYKNQGIHSLLFFVTFRNVTLVYDKKFLTPSSNRRSCSQLRVRVP